MSPDPRFRPIDRRRFLQLLGAAGGVSVLAACSGSSKNPAVGAATTATPTSVFSGAVPTKTLVIVQLNGGNDGLNTLVPADGRYRDARPTLAIPEKDVLTLKGLDGFGFHPSLAPLQRLWDDQRLGLVQSIGYPEPDRSHFVAMDSWWRADDPTLTTGWLGRAFDAISGELDPLFAVALGAQAPVLHGDHSWPIEVLRSGDFRFADLVETDMLRSLGSPLSTDPLFALAQQAFERAVDAVAEFDHVTSSSQDDNADTGSDREGGASIAAGLHTAAQLIVTGKASKLIVVTAGGFDTHADQLDTHAALLSDLASGIDTFYAALEKAGVADDVLLVTTSEFGRRVAENASGGTDHGKGGLTFMAGKGASPGLHGTLDLKDLQDGDVRSQVDPRTLFTACLDWIGADAKSVLGVRYDEERLLR